MESLTGLTHDRFFKHFTLAHGRFIKPFKNPLCARNVVYVVTLEDSKETVGSRYKVKQKTNHPVKGKIHESCKLSLCETKMCRFCHR